MKLKNVLIVMLSLYNLSFGQNWLKVDSIFAPLGVGVSTFSNPFLFDYDKDGHKDLFLGTSEMETKFYRCKSGSNLPSAYSAVDLLHQIYANGYQYTNAYYPVLVDIDNDLNFELIIGGFKGLLLYKNTGTYSEPNWIQVDTAFADVNPNIGSDAKPAFVDIDNDGDLDLFMGIGESLLGGPTAGILMGFRNTGDANNPHYLLDNTLTTGISDAGINNFPTFADLDNDGDFDLLIGRDLQTFQFYKNTGTDKTPVWTPNASVFAGVENTTYWKSPQLVDLDNDGDFDLLYGTSDGNLFYYQNVGTITAPSYSYKSDYFKIIKNDGSAASMSIADFDHDGDYDFVSGSWSTKFNYFKNNGTPTEPVFAKSTSSFTSLSTASSYANPEFVDLDNDGDFDIVAGMLNGKLQCWINNNGTFQANTTTFASIFVSGFSSPAFGDLDNDGDMDLLLASEESSETSFYVNNNGIFTSDNSFIRNITFESNINPTFSDVDNDGDLDLVFGNRWGEYIYYENTGNVSTPTWNLNTEIFNGIEVQQNAHVAFADFDGDTRKDMILAEYNGAFTYYKNLFAVVSVDDEANPIIPSNISIANYPNPFNPSTTFQFNLTEYSHVKLTIYNSIGQQICTLIDQPYQAGLSKIQFNSNQFNLSSGVYLYRFESSSINGVEKNQVLFGKILLMK